MDPGEVALDLGRIGRAVQARLVRDGRYVQDQLVEAEGHDSVG